MRFAPGGPIDKGRESPTPPRACRHSLTEPSYLRLNSRQPALCFASLLLFLLALVAPPASGRNRHAPSATSNSSPLRQSKQQPAPAAWLEVRSPHFTVFTDAAARQGGDIAAHFEQIRAVFQAAMPGSRVDPAAPMRIIAVRNEAELSHLLPEYWVSSSTMHPAGYFSGGEESNYIVLRLDATAGNDYLILYHEYVHLLENLNFPGLPVWASEGLADYYGSIRVTGGKVGIGYPLQQHIQLLSAGQRMPLEELLSTTETSPDYIREGASTIFYAESWALADFLLTADDGAHRPAFLRYLSLVSHGTGSVDAARQTFGNLDRLSETLFAFLSKGQLPYYTIRAPFVPGANGFSIRPVSLAEADAVCGDFMVFRGHPDEGKPMLEEAMRIDPSLAAPYASMGLLYLRAGNQPVALSWLDRAAQRSSRDYLGWYYRALLSLRLRPGPDTARQAESDLETCLRLDPNFAPGYRALADLRSLSSENSAQAVSLARQAISLDPLSPENHLTLGIIFLRQRNTTEAEAEGRRALALASNAGQRSNASRFLNVVSQTRAALAAGSDVHIDIPPASVSDTLAQSAPPQPSPPPQPESPTDLKGTRTTQPVPGTDTSGLSATGTAENVTCRDRTLSFTLVTSTGRLSVQAVDFTKLTYESTAPVATGIFLPCTELSGRRITAYFRKVSVPSATRELTGILLER